MTCFVYKLIAKINFQKKMADSEEDGESEKRYFKLNVHTQSFFPEDLIIRFVTPLTPNPSTPIELLTLWRTCPIHNSTLDTFVWLQKSSILQNFKYSHWLCIFKESALYNLYKYIVAEEPPGRLASSFSLVYMIYIIIS